MAAMFAWGVLAGIAIVLYLAFVALPRWIVRRCQSWRESRFFSRKFFTREFSNTKYKFKPCKTLRRRLL